MYLYISKYIQYMLLSYKFRFIYLRHSFQRKTHFLLLGAFQRHRKVLPLPAQPNFNLSTCDVSAATEQKDEVTAAWQVLRSVSTSLWSPSVFFSVCCFVAAMASASAVVGFAIGMLWLCIEVFCCNASFNSVRITVLFNGLVNSCNDVLPSG